MDKLDTVLFYLKLNKDKFIEFRDIEKHFIGKIDRGDLQLIVHKLELDGYIERESKYRTIKQGTLEETFHDNFYRVNYIGLLYEGYIITSEAAKKQRKIQNLKDVLLIVAAWLAGLYGLFEFLKWTISYYQNYICKCHFFLEN